jgi:hypothetical protein
MSSVLEYQTDTASATGDSSRWRVYGLRAVIWVLIVVALSVCAVEGWKLRRWVFDAFDPVRFIGDMQRGTYWGLEASGPEGYLNQFDKMDPQVPEWQDDRWVPWLDYNPLRLGVMYEWGRWQWKHAPPDSGVANLDAWRHEYAFNWPVLTFNAVLESISAIFALLLTHHWVRRGTPAAERKHFTGVWQGAAAGLFIWFSPDIIVNAHGWVQWDTWVVPWYLGACFLASIDWWFLAGVMIAIGINFKGQMFPVAPIFIIWPLVQGRVGAAARWVCGAGLCYSLIVSGWMLSYIPPDLLAKARAVQDTMSVSDYSPTLFAIPRTFDMPAAVWIFEMLLVVLTVPWLLRVLMPQSSEVDSSKPTWKRLAKSPGVWIAAAAVIITATVFWPWLIPQNRGSWYFGPVVGAAVAAAALSLPRRATPYFLAAIAAGGLFGCMALFHGGTGWWDCGVHYGSVHWPYLTTGPTSNIPGLFQHRFNWPREVDEIAFTLPSVGQHWSSFFVSRGWWPAFGLDVTEKMLFNSIFIVTLIASGIGIGIQTRRNDRRALIAFVTPWIMMFLWAVQMQERYLLYGAAAAACCIGEGFGMALLGLMLTCLSFMMMSVDLLDAGWSDPNLLGQNISNAVPWLLSPDCAQTLRDFVDNSHPDAAWAILVIGLVFLYLSLTPSRRWRERKITPSAAAG